MTREKRRYFSWEFKRRIVDQYSRGELSAAQLASQHNLHPDFIYKWKYELEKQRKKDREAELAGEGRSSEDIRTIMQLEEEIGEYKKKVGELSLENDLLKKLNPNFQHTKNVSGLERIKRELGRSRRGAR